MSPTGYTAAKPEADATPETDAAAAGYIGLVKNTH